MESSIKEVKEEEKDSVPSTVQEEDEEQLAEEGTSETDEHNDSQVLTFASVATDDQLKLKGVKRNRNNSDAKVEPVLQKSESE